MVYEGVLLPIAPRLLGGMPEKGLSKIKGRSVQFRIALFDKATRGLLATDHVIWNHGQVTWATPELALPLLTTTPHQRDNFSPLDRFNVHRCLTRWVFSGTGLELVTRQATIRYLYHFATAATLGDEPRNFEPWSSDVDNT
ncbi:uncharacterized protein TNCV_191231 [Trichonephila clavipes]|nr:uncharacterized protein TNCV_191231 [Trichonephila clavipes]